MLDGCVAGMNTTNRMLRTTILGPISMNVAGCAAAPSNETVYSSGGTDRGIPFEGKVDVLGEEGTLSASVDRRWEELGIATAATRPTSLGTGGWTNVSNLYKWSVATSVGENGEYWEPNQAVQTRIDRQYGAEVFGFTSRSEVFSTVQTGGLVQVDVHGDRALPPDALRFGCQLPHGASRRERHVQCRLLRGWGGPVSAWGQV